MTNRPPDPTENNVRTFYERPLLDRITGRYTVAWKNEGQLATIRVHNRLTDMEGNRPSLGSLMRLPETLATYVEARRHPILDVPRPFLVHEAIDHLDTLVGPGTRVLELGGGNSTLWFLGKGAQVTTVEHSEEWAERIGTEAEARFGHEGRGKLTLFVAEGETALAAVASTLDGSFDLALVDCMNAHTWRHDGVLASLPKIRSGGTLCLDNSDHPNNWAVVSKLGRETRRRFTGYAPMCPVVSQTSFWTLG